MSRPCAYAGGNTAKYERVIFRRLFKRKKHTNDIRETCELKIQIWKQAFLVQRILCRYSRKKCKENSRVYSESATRRFGIRPDDAEGVYRPVYG